MDETAGWCFDTYDTRVGPVYLWLARRRAHRVARMLLYGLYAVEAIAPITYRRLRGIRPTWDPMGNSYRAGVQLSLYEADRDPAHLTRAARILEEIASHAVGARGARGFALGFPCITGSNKLWRTSVPVAHYTLRVARKFLRWEQVTGDTRFQFIVRESMTFLLEGLQWTERDGVLGVAYTPDDPLHVINIWADVASLLAACDLQYGDSRCRERALKLLASVVAHQDPDGGWPYYARWESATNERDNGHTAMVLGALADLCLSYPELGRSATSALQRGVPRWIEMFFDEQTGRFWNLVSRPKDVFTVAFGDALYAINRLLRPGIGLAPGLVCRLSTLEQRIIAWALDTLLLPDGHFCERRLRLRLYTLKSIRSFDGLVCDALALFLARSKLGPSYRLWTQ